MSWISYETYEILNIEKKRVRLRSIHKLTESCNWTWDYHKIISDPQKTENSLNRAGKRMDSIKKRICLQNWKKLVENEAN